MSIRGAGAGGLDLRLDPPEQFPPVAAPISSTLSPPNVSFCSLRRMDGEASRSEEEEEFLTPALPSSSRQMRNQAEKLRRDKLNQFINELALLVPMVSTSAKKLDKTSILRLSATFLRMHQILVGAQKSETMKDLAIPMEWCQTVLEGMEGMLLVVTSSGKIVYITHNVEHMLGYHQNDLLGQSLFNITNLDDHDDLRKNLKPKEAEDGMIRIDGEESRLPERRSFYLRLRLRAASRADQPQYEMVHIAGHLRVPRKPFSSQASTSTSLQLVPARSTRIHNGGVSSDGYNSNEVILVAVVKPYKEVKINESCLLEATREEWITRHLIDGTIVYADHRISVVSGYLSEEVTGSPAFKYMHMNDVRWVLLSLRDMYVTGDSSGNSCYRLKVKTGEFIYIRTHGYLELSDTGSVQSFICINSLVSPDEGERFIADMKSRCIQMLKDARASKSTRKASSNKAIMDVDGEGEEEGDGAGGSCDPPLHVEDPTELNLAVEAMLLSDIPQIESRHPPPSSDEKYEKVARMSRILPPLEEQSSKVGIILPIVRGKYNRPTVITSVAGSKRTAREEFEDKQEEGMSCLGGGVKRVRPESVIVSDERRVRRAAVIQRNESSLDCQPLSPLDPALLFGPAADLLLETTSSHLSSDTFDDSLQIPIGVKGGGGGELWESCSVSELEEGVLRGQLQLENRLQRQTAQIQEIEEDLTAVPITTTHLLDYRSTFTHLKEEHRKQQEMLKTLQQDHQSIQHPPCKDQLQIRGAQDIGA